MKDQKQIIAEEFRRLCKESRKDILNKITTLTKELYGNNTILLPGTMSEYDWRLHEQAFDIFIDFNN